MFTLHRYYITASTMRSTFGKWMQTHPEGPFANDAYRFPEWVAHLSVWYATLFAAWEGWNRLAADFSLHNDTLDELWSNPLRPLLHGYRNATMHYSRDYLDERMTKFYEDPASAEFAHNVHEALGNAILAELDRISAEGGGPTRAPAV